MSESESKSDTVHEIAKQDPENAIEGHGTVVAYWNSSETLTIRQDSWPDEDDSMIVLPFERIPELMRILDRLYRKRAAENAENSGLPFIGK